MALKVTIFKPATGKYKHLVTFDLVGGKVVAKWQDGSEWFQDSIMNHGIVTSAGNLKMGDGQKFMDNLELAYSHSSKIMVEKV
jgi:hypothetical protein